MQEGASEWVALEDERVVAGVRTMERPDGRTFLRFSGDWERAAQPLTGAVAEEVDGPLFAFADADAPACVALRSAGFAVDLVEERFRVPFATALAALRRAPTPSEIEVVSIATLVPTSVQQPPDAGTAKHNERLVFDLDNTIRNDVPGTDGWIGNLSWFRDEISESPPFDPSAYLVAIDRAGGYVGLVRIWRNPTGPRLGLVGVRREWRGTFLAAALLKRALTAAAGWGHETFVTETSPSNPVVYNNLVRLGASREGQFYQMVRRPRPETAHSA